MLGRNPLVTYRLGYFFLLILAMLCRFDADKAARKYYITIPIEKKQEPRVGEYISSVNSLHDGIVAKLEAVGLTRIFTASLPGERHYIGDKGTLTYDNSQFEVNIPKTLSNMENSAFAAVVRWQDYKGTRLKVTAKDGNGNTMVFINRPPSSGESGALTPSDSDRDIMETVGFLHFVPVPGE